MGSVGLPFFVRIVRPAGVAVTAALVQMYRPQDTCIYQCHAYNRHNYNNALNLLHNRSLAGCVAFGSAAVLSLPKE